MRQSPGVEWPVKSAELLALAEAVQAARQARGATFPKLANLIADPTWDILLFLFIAQMRGELATVIRACDSTFAPRATAIRHIRMCEEYGYVSRNADTMDRRRVFLSLTPSSFAQMRKYFEHMPLTPGFGGRFAAVPTP